MPTPTDAALLQRAADLMKDRGHAKHKLVDDDGRVCLLGALSLACADSPLKLPQRSFDLLKKVEKYLMRKKKVSQFDAVAWNNKTKTRASEVMAALRGTARSIARV